MATGNLKAIYGGNYGASPNGLQSGTFGTGIGFNQVTGINISSSLTTILSLSGKFVIGSASVSGLPATAGQLNLVVEVDGVTILNLSDAASTVTVVGIVSSQIPIACSSSFVVKMQKPTATAVNLSYQAIGVL